MYIYALGFFDGVHLGHAALMEGCRELARARGTTPGVVTFGNHPDGLVLGRSPGLISTDRDREKLLRETFSMERVVTLPFDEKMCATGWREFLTMLVSDYGADGFVCGDDFRFGRRGEGTAEDLCRFCRERGLGSLVVPQMDLDGVRVSSTYIRTLVEAGDMERARRFLGHPYRLTGTVIHGKGLGGRLGFPTANLPFPDSLARPRFGVYACMAEGPDFCRMAVTNLGIRPTVNGQGVNAESWILDYDGGLYGRELTLRFYKFLRPERKFASLEELREAIFRNAEETRQYFDSAR